jgi:hypothetical protein
MAPFALDLGGGPIGVITALPVSRRTIGLSYWCVAVLLPVIIMAGTIGLVGLFFPSVTTSCKNAAMFLIGSLVVAGACFCLFTKPTKRSCDPAESLLRLLCSLWFLFVIFSVFDTKLFEIKWPSPVGYLGGLIGVVLTVWGYFRAEKLQAVWGWLRPGSGQPFAQASKRIRVDKPGMARFRGVLFDVVWRSFLGGLLVSTLWLFFKTHLSEDHSAWPYLFAFGGVGSVQRLCGGIRLLRCLPLSAGQLGLTLLLMPLLSILAIVAGVATMQWISPGQLPSHYSASLMISMTGVACLAAGLIVPLGRDGLLLAMLASLVISDIIPNVKWPAAFWWLLGLGLMAAAFFLNRHWLRSSASYRPSAANSQRR